MSTIRLGRTVVAVFIRPIGRRAGRNIGMLRFLGVLFFLIAYLVVILVEPGHFVYLPKQFFGSTCK